MTTFLEQFRPHVPVVVEQKLVNRAFDRMAGLKCRLCGGRLEDPEDQASDRFVSVTEDTCNACIRDERRRRAGR